MGGMGLENFGVSQKKNDGFKILVWVTGFPIVGGAPPLPSYVAQFCWLPPPTGHLPLYIKVCSPHYLEWIPPSLGFPFLHHSMQRAINLPLENYPPPITILCWVRALVFLVIFACLFFAWHFSFLSCTKDVGKQVLIPAGIYLLRVSNRNTRTRCEICSKLTIKTPEQCQWCYSGVFIVNYEDISHLVLVFLLLTLNM